MMLGQLLSFVIDLLSTEPVEFVYDVGSPPEPPVARTISIVKMPRMSKQISVQEPE